MWKIEKGLEKSTEKLKLEKRKIFKKMKKKKKNNPYFRLFFKGFPALNLPLRPYST